MASKRCGVCKRAGGPLRYSHKLGMFVHPERCYHRAYRKGSWFLKKCYKCGKRRQAAVRLRKQDKLGRSRRVYICDSCWYHRITEVCGGCQEKKIIQALGLCYRCYKIQQRAKMAKKRKRKVA